MVNPNTKIFTAYEDSKCFAEIGACLGLREITDCLPDVKEPNTIDFSQFWTEDSWGGAVQHALSADVIIISLSGGSDLPMPVRRWLESVPCQETVNRTSLAVIFGKEDGDASRRDALTTYFKHIADSHGMTFFCNRNSSAIAAPPATELQRN